MRVSFPSLEARLAIGVVGLAKSTANRQVSIDIPGIGQDDLFAGTGSRRAFTLLHGHQVADIGQHRLEVRHFPRWSLNLLTWIGLTLELFPRRHSVHCRRHVALTVATPGTTRPTPTFWSSDQRIHSSPRVWQLRRGSARDFQRGNLDSWSCTRG